MPDGDKSDLADDIVRETDMDAREAVESQGTS
jgi:hypothetical protein